MSVSFEKDMIDLLPNRYRSYPVLNDFISTLGKWIDENPKRVLEEMPNLLSYEKVPLDFVYYLAGNMGFRLSVFDALSVYRLLSHIIAIYKTKGTYRSIDYVLYSFGLRGRVNELYTYEYKNFFRKEWECGGIVDESSVLRFDTGLRLDDGKNLDYAYKTPHFELEIDLDRRESEEYLMSCRRYFSLVNVIDFIRPVNTVPHYVFILKAYTTSSGKVYIDSVSGVSAVITDNLILGELVFDVGLKLDTGLYMDSGILGSLDLFKKIWVGTGRVGGVADKNFVGLENKVYEGDVGSVSFDSGKNLITIISEIPVGEEIISVSELGLFTGSGDKLVDICCPKICKLKEVLLRVIVEIKIISGGNEGGGGGSE